MAISLIVFACVFGGAVMGVLFRGSLPESHLSADSQGVVRLGMGFVATMAALVLGLLVSSAKNSYDAQGAEVMDMSSKVIFLDRVLAHYGSETKEARDLLRGAVVANLDRIWPQERMRASEVVPSSTGADVLIDKIQALSPKDDTQRSLKAQSLSMVLGLGQTRWLMYEQGAGSVSTPMLVILVFWLAAIFISFSLFALVERCRSLHRLWAVGFLCNLRLEMYTPFGGLIEISSAPCVRSAPG